MFKNVIISKNRATFVKFNHNRLVINFSDKIMVFRASIDIFQIFQEIITSNRILDVTNVEDINHKMWY